MNPDGGSDPGIAGSAGAAGGPGGAGGSGPGGPGGPGRSGGATGSADIGGSSDDNRDSVGTSSKDCSQLDQKEHVPLPPLVGVNYEVYGTNSSGLFQGLLNALDVNH